MTAKKKESKYDDSRYVDWAIEVVKPVKTSKPKKKTTTKKAKK